MLFSVFEDFSSAHSLAVCASTVSGFSLAHFLASSTSKSG
jgi:hypothetical protein